MSRTPGQPYPPPMPSPLTYSAGASELSSMPGWVGSVSIVYAATRLILFCLNRLSDRVGSTSLRYDPFWVMVEIALDVLTALAALTLVAGAIGCLQRNQWGRVMVMIVLLILAASDFCHALAMSLRFTARDLSRPGAWMFLATTGLYVCHALVFPLGVAWLLSRRQARMAFQ